MRSSATVADFSEIFLQGIGALRTLFYPSHCGACGCRLEDGGKDGDERNCGKLLCGACRELIVEPSEFVCPVCSHPMSGLFLCPNCEDRHWHLSVIVAGCRYEGLVRDLIHRFKYGRDQSLVPLLSLLMARALGDPRISGKTFDAVVAVPLHPLREREREFNQASLLAVGMGKRLGIPVIAPLSRTRATAPQARFDRVERLENMKDVFVLRGKMPRESTLLLVDDVATTGATLDACAALLMEAGASEVCAVTIARG